MPRQSKWKNCVAAACPSEGKRRRKEFQSVLETYMCENNEFEWNPSERDTNVSKELIRIYNSKFKNNEPLVAYKYQDYMLKNVDLQEVDVSGLFVENESTNHATTSPVNDDNVVKTSVTHTYNDTRR